MEAAGLVGVIAAVEEVGGGFGSQQGGFFGAEQIEFRIDRGEGEVLLEEAITEAVHGADVGVLGKLRLAGETRVGRMLDKPAAQGGLNSRLHFRGGGFGERDDQELIDIARRFGVADKMRAALGEDGGFA